MVTCKVKKVGLRGERRLSLQSDRLSEMADEENWGLGRVSLVLPTES